MDKRGSSVEVTSACPGEVCRHVEGGGAGALKCSVQRSRVESLAGLEILVCQRDRGKAANIQQRCFCTGVKLGDENIGK
jgi:hypothetical protein